MTQYAGFFISPFSEKSATDELNAFLKSHRIINVEKKLLDGERGTGWAFLIEYANNDGRPGGAAGQASRVDYREILGPAEYALYHKLRAARKDLAEKSGIPVYAVFTNDQLAAMAKKPARTLKELSAIPGVGEGRVKQYGQALLDVLAAEGGTSPPEQKEQADETAGPPF